MIYCKKLDHPCYRKTIALPFQTEEVCFEYWSFEAIYHRLQTESGKRSRKNAKDLADRKERIAYYQSWTKSVSFPWRKKISMTTFPGCGPCWSGGNKHYVVDKIIADNGFDNLKRELSELIWSTSPVIKRWDNFLKKCEGIWPGNDQRDPVPRLSWPMHALESSCLCRIELSWRNRPPPIQLSDDW